MLLLSRVAFGELTFIFNYFYVITFFSSFFLLYLSNLPIYLKLLTFSKIELSCLEGDSKGILRMLSFK